MDLLVKVRAVVATAIRIAITQIPVTIQETVKLTMRSLERLVMMVKKMLSAQLINAMQAGNARMLHCPITVFVTATV
jgi:hypothetical protein